MKKTIYSAVLVLAAITARAQTPVLETREPLADAILIRDDLMVYTKKEALGQFLYRADKSSGQLVRDTQLNAGAINAVVGTDPATGEFYVYQQTGPKAGRIAIYLPAEDGFTKTGELPVPRLKNNSQQLGMHLTSDRQRLYLSAELGKSEGYEDLYLSQWQNGRWTKPQPMAKTVNTRSPEFAPFVAEGTLYFSRKEGQAAYTYAVALEDGKPKGEPVRLPAPKNQDGAFQASYRRVGERELWISGKDGLQTVYLLGPSLEAGANPLTDAAAAVAPAPEQNVPRSESTEEVTPPTLASTAAAHDKAPLVPESPAARETAPGSDTIAEVFEGQQLYYDLNQVFMGPAEERALRNFLQNLPSAASITITGYSDAIGSTSAKERVSRQRAAFVKGYIAQHFAGRRFTLVTKHQVLTERGKSARRVDLQVR